MDRGYLQQTARSCVARVENLRANISLDLRPFIPKTWAFCPQTLETSTCGGPALRAGRTQPCASSTDQGLTAPGGRDLGPWRHRRRPLAASVDPHQWCTALPPLVRP